MMNLGRKEKQSEIPSVETDLQHLNAREWREIRSVWDVRAVSASACMRVARKFYHHQAGGARNGMVKPNGPDFWEIWHLWRHNQIWSVCYQYQFFGGFFWCSQPLANFRNKFILVTKNDQANETILDLYFERNEFRSETIWVSDTVLNSKMSHLGDWNSWFFSDASRPNDTSFWRMTMMTTISEHFIRSVDFMFK